MLFDHPPERARIWGADGLAFEHNGGVARNQRGIADIAVAHDPAHVRGSPKDLSRLDVIDVLHRPVQRHQMPRRGAHHALGRAGGARGVKDIGRVVPLNRNAWGRAHAVLGGVPVDVPLGVQLTGFLAALQDDAGVGLVCGLFDGPVQ